jgi:hypothetical protein
MSCWYRAASGRVTTLSSTPGGLAVRATRGLTDLLSRASYLLCLQRLGLLPL